MISRRGLAVFTIVLIDVVSLSDAWKQKHVTNVAVTPPVDDYSTSITHQNQPTSRRSWLANAATATSASTLALMMIGTTTTTNSVASAAAYEQPQEFKNVGSQAPLPEGESAPFRTLSNSGGIQVKDYRLGFDNAPVVKTTSRVDLQITGRLLNLNGVIFYSTKNNKKEDGFGPEPLTVSLGSGQLLPGLEAGLVGMKKDGIRRIIVPPEQAYSAFPNLEPQPTAVEDIRALDSVLKNPRRDATILFDVQVERVK
eukprot:CAMPEP_0194033480 /NCGR_PEP_ID=MMETSP0009_2-20130614/6160_1 /TAXON_ID=210454 /ORGANISM="Grammatophora oceanica, Strain CCMP 410" /LENGTH=254 /DNA_ID=CAMNT_0038674181 /DNA_START=50 /DNA_END=814 /DNA_ORIENTATION=+